MAAKKKQTESTSLQIEVETEMQWRNLLRREGLIIVDVYAGFAGPCVSMVSILKRVKVEVNDDRLWLAVANSDNISDLLMFKDQSEPTWLFVGGGKPIKVVRGANAPKLVQTIKSEFEHELLCMTGKSRRNLISIDDEVTRRKKAEAEAMRLSKLIKEEDESADELNKLRQQSSIRLMTNTEAYTVLVIQSFLLETGAVTEIRDALQGEFKIEQERIMNLYEAGVRNLFRIPTEILDPNEPLEDFGYVEPEIKDDEKDGNDDRDDDQTNPEERENTEDMESAPKQGKKKKKMIPVLLPEGLEGETLFMLIESVEVRKLMNAGKKPDPNSLLQTADDYIQLKAGSEIKNFHHFLYSAIWRNPEKVLGSIKAYGYISHPDYNRSFMVGPVDLKDAIDHAPYSWHALYGKEKYAPGIWCPRRYDDKRYVLLNFFPRFVTDILMPPPKGMPKYMVAVYPVEMAADVSREVDFHKKDILAEGKIKLSPEIAEEMLHSWSTSPTEHEDRKKALTKPQVYALSVDKKNSALMLALQGLEPLHMSYDSGYGKVESSKLFKNLKITLDDMPNPDVVVEKFLARSMPRMKSVTEIAEVDIPKQSIKSTESGSEIAAETAASTAQSRKSIIHGGEVRRESRHMSTSSKAATPTSGKDSAEGDEGSAGGSGGGEDEAEAEAAEGQMEGEDEEETEAEEGV